MNTHKIKSIIFFMNIVLVSLSLTYFQTIHAKGKNKSIRGIVKIKPVYIGITHYFPWSYPTSPLTMEELKKRTQEMVDGFKKNLEVDFLEVEDSFIIKEHEDFRKLKEELTYDTDALLVGGSRGTLENYSLLRYKLPIIRGGCSSDFLRALRVKKFLSESKFIYIGEFPSYSIGETPFSGIGIDVGPRNLFSCENRFGVRAKQIETIEFYRIFDSFKEEEVRKELSNWRKDFDEVSEPTENHKLSVVKDEKDLMSATRVYLALRSLALREDANGICVNCNRMWIQDERHIVPCLAYDRLIDEGIMCACEGDVGNMISALILHAVSGGQAVLMGNTRWRPDEGIIYIQHGIIPLSMAKTKYKIRNYHAKGWGVTAYADVKTGPMTVINIGPSYSKICVVEGTIKGSFEPSDEDAARGACRFRVNMSVNGDIQKIPSIWVGSQHHSMTFGHLLNALLEAGKLLDFEVLHLK